MAEDRHLTEFKNRVAAHFVLSTTRRFHPCIAISWRMLLRIAISNEAPIYQEIPPKYK
jgi:hypothetical protein